MAGLTVNLVVLFSLILAVGMLVDDAIIVVEYAERRMRAWKSAMPLPGQSPDGGARHRLDPDADCSVLAPAVLAGVVGEFMKYMPITLIATLSAVYSMR